MTHFGSRRPQGAKLGGVKKFEIFLCSKNQIPPTASVFTEGDQLLGGHGRPPGTPPTQGGNSLVYPSS